MVLTLHKHKEEEFWLWVSSWALFVTKPSDITQNENDDVGYILPELDLRWHEIPTNHENAGAEKDGQLKLFKDTALGLEQSAKEKRESIGAFCKQLIAEGKTNDEILAAVHEKFPQAKTTKGSLAYYRNALKKAA